MTQLQMELLYKLCAIPSITTTAAEDAVPLFLHKELSSWPYFAEHPENIWLDALKNDALGRHNFCAMVKSSIPTKRTLILLSHHDVVPVDNCKPELSMRATHAASPFDIAAYTEAIKHADIDSETRADIESGDWLFGRGVSDMKSGMAAQLALLAEFAENPTTLDANILLMTMADEENNGAGVHQAVRTLERMQAEDGLEFIACIDSEPTISNENKDCARIYTGTIGNATLFAMAVGRASHVGEYFSGINSTSLISQLVLLIESAHSTSDIWQGKRYSPATCLYLEDLNSSYSVTLPEKSVALFNVLMITKTPSEQLHFLNSMAQTAANDVLNLLYRRREGLRGSGYLELPRHKDKAKVISYAELVAMLKLSCDVRKVQQEFLDSLQPDLSDQARGIALVSHMAELAKLEAPYIVTGFLSYCQPRVNLRQSAGEKALMAAVQRVIDYAKTQHNHELIHEEVFEGISDMSELGYQGSAEDLQLLTDNFIGWGVEHNYPFAEMQKLNVPVVNLGPIGKDAHKMTERLDRDFYVNTLPDLLRKLVKELIRK
ncbi:MAG: M20/M25/M40 family metallo-hydrolase [Deferribacteraceae bacterium]|jgi:arginine utilization protein RocB|nr:M20/M25/M40 family metallo-hydrolase [Deferribacteraceae bacterium]